MNGTQASLPNNNSEIDSSRAEDEIRTASNSTATVLVAALTTTLSSTTTATNAASLTTLTWKNLTVEAWTAISVLAFIGLWISGLLLRFVVYVIKKRFQERDRPKSMRAKAKIVSFVDDKQIKVELDRV